MSKTATFNPFPGLRPFGAGDSDIFFGREAQTGEVLEKLLKNRFVTITGDSGSGKTSLIFSGVLPRLLKSSINGSKKWKPITFQPGNEPVNNLAEALFLFLKSEGIKKEKKKITDLLMEDPDGLSKVLKSVTNPESDRILFVIDQFEEIFRYGKTALTRNAGVVYSIFINLIINAFTKSDGDIYILLSMRSDYIGECSHYTEFTKLINASNYLVPQLSNEDYNEAITGPVKYAGAEIDPLLVKAILEDLGERKDQLPVLQHALMRAWDFWAKIEDHERPIGFSDYDSVGGMSYALSRHADEVFDELNMRSRSICETLFKTITEKVSDNRNIRHPSTVKTIAGVAGCRDEELLDIIDKFRRQSRSFITPLQEVPLTSDSVIDISHECIIRLWDRLYNWVDEEAASVQMYLKLSVASGMYHQGKTSLLKPPDLQLALKWRDEKKPTLKWAERYNPAFERTIVYIKTSEREFKIEEENKLRLQKRRLKRNKRAAIIFGGAATVTSLLMVLSVFKRSEAVKEKAEALTQLSEPTVQ